MLICMQKISFFSNFFLKILQRNSKLVTLGNLGMPCPKSTSSPTFFWKYWKDMQTFYFRYFGHAWLRTPKMIVPTYRKLWCLFACQKYTSSFTSFLRYYILKNPANWLANSTFPITRKPEFCQIWNEISRKTKFFHKLQKVLYWDHFGPFLPKFGQKWIFLKKRALSVF